MDKIFNKPFAINGARVAIPENGTENERVSFDKGFTQPYEVEAPSVDNPNGQGFNILRPEMNEILNQLSNACNFLAENIDKWTCLTTENLNDITQNGRYYQPLRSQATSANNYPEQAEGYLFVISTISNTQTQIFKLAINNNFYFRYKIGNTWGEWIENLTTENAYRKNEVDVLVNTATTAPGQRVKAIFAHLNSTTGDPTLEFQIGGCSISKINVVKWRITHNIGNLQYVPVGNLIPVAEQWEATLSLSNITDNFFDVTFAEGDNHDPDAKVKGITAIIAY